MKDEDKTKEQLIDELAETRQRVAELEASEAGRKSAEEELRHAHREWEDIFQTIGHSTLILDPQHRVLAANRATVKATGRSEKELCDKKCYEIFHRTNEPPKWCPMEKMLISGHFETIEMEIETLGGTFLVSCTPMHDDTGCLARVIHFATDVSKRKRAGEALRKSKSMLQAVFDGISEPLIMLGSDLSVQMLNDAAMKYYGVRRLEEVDAKCCFKAFMGKSSPCEGCKIPSAVLSDQGKTFEQSSVIHSGRFEQVIIYPLQQEEGEVTGAIIRISDITEKKKIEEQLIRANRLASLGQLSGGIAHEIRNPLAAVSLFVDILCDKNKFDQSDMELEVLGHIKDDINKIAAIIKRVLEFAKPSAASSREIDVNTLIHENLKLWSAKIRKSKIRLELSLEESHPSIVGDPVELQQVINNLVSNAIDAMSRGGVLSVTARKGISFFHKGRRIVIINVKDAGPGIKREHAESIFNPFFTTKATGTGLGLAISHQIIERHGGVISFESKPDEGTTFTIELPAIGRNG
jgi:two-component system cell cycle sensor histidine kinase/response regulator CckA